jgi:hypothetical protein
MEDLRRFLNSQPLSLRVEAEDSDSHQHAHSREKEKEAPPHGTQHGQVRLHTSTGKAVDHQIMLLTKEERTDDGSPLLARRSVLLNR